MADTGDTLSAPGAIEVLSPQKFLEDVAQLIVNWPLYRQYKFSGERREPNPNFNGRYTLQLPIGFVNACPQCKHNQPWDIKSPYRGKSDLGFERVTYECRACGVAQHYWLFLDCDCSGGSIVKTGQFPALELDPPTIVAVGMEKSDLRLYRHALTCRHSNFSIAAVAYLRRIVENRTNFLIDLMAARLQEEDPTSPALQRVEEVKNDYRFSEKIDFAKDLLPKSVRLGGHNPISTLHELTSEALHGLSD